MVATAAYADVHAALDVLEVLIKLAAQDSQPALVGWAQVELSGFGGCSQSFLCIKLGAGRGAGWYFFRKKNSLRSDTFFLQKYHPTPRPVRLWS
jgi:hypothetical protein